MSKEQPLWRVTMIMALTLLLGAGGMAAPGVMGELGLEGQARAEGSAPMERAATATPAPDVDVFIDGTRLDMPDPPAIYEGRTLVPMRHFFEGLGADVSWDGDNLIARGSRGGIEVLIPIWSNQPTVNGEVVTIDVAAQLWNGRTYVPLRFVGEALGDQVRWDGDNRQIFLTSTGGPGPAPDPDPTPDPDPEGEDPAELEALSPADGDFIPGTSITFQWEAAEGAEDYAIRIVRQGDGTVFYNRITGSTNNSYPVANFLDDGEVYCWQVRVLTAEGWSDWSDTNCFTNSQDPRHFYEDDEDLVSVTGQVTRTIPGTSSSLPREIPFTNENQARVIIAREMNYDGQQHRLEVTGKVADVMTGADGAWEAEIPPGVYQKFVWSGGVMTWGEVQRTLYYTPDISRGLEVEAGDRVVDLGSINLLTSDWIGHQSPLTVTSADMVF